MYYNIAQRILEPTIKNNFDIIAVSVKKLKTFLIKRLKSVFKVQKLIITKKKQGALLIIFQMLKAILKEKIVFFRQL